MIQSLAGEEENDMEKRKRLKYSIIFFLLLGILFLMIYTAVLQSQYRKYALEAAVAKNVSSSDAIHRLVTNKFIKEDFENITNIKDMESERYKQLQQSLNEIRTLNSTRYLYTAKRGDDGKLIYQIDGLELDAEDFAYPGTYIEKEMIPYIEDALNGKTTYSQDVVDTTWGHIFTACYPVNDNEDSSKIIGALCIEIDMEDTYSFLEKSRTMSITAMSIAGIILIFMGIGIYFTLHKYKEKEEEQQLILQKTAEAAKTANKAKSTFLFNMSHDIRTPMNAILGYTELADKNITDQKRLQDYHEKIRICSQKLLSILVNVLEISRIESGKTIIEKSANEVEKILKDCLLMVQMEIEKKQQIVSIHKDIKYPYLYFDAPHVAEIILNLISNAIKYTSEGGKIVCTLRQRENPKDGWINQEIIVADNGIGMSEEFQSHIFETFVRERSSTVSGIEGTGLGMGIVKNLVENMDGRVEVKSKLGEGSSFIVSIPCRIASFEDTQPKQAETHIDKEKIVKTHILLAEDNELNAEIAMTLLSDEGFNVERAENGVKCIEMLEKAPKGYYSLILMDIQMPVLNGYEATRKIRRLADTEISNIPIIAMTANAFSEDKERALEVGMNDYATKPIDMNKLIPVMLKYIQK